MLRCVYDEPCVISSAAFYLAGEERQLPLELTMVMLFITPIQIIDNSLLLGRATITVLLLNMQPTMSTK